VRGYILLADFAEAIGGKLYIQGGGWSQLHLGAPVADIYVAGMVYVPWDDANRRRRLLLQLIDQDGVEVTLDGQPVEMRGEFEVGRPPGMTPGTEIEFPISAKFAGLPLQPGRYKFQLTVGATHIGDANFEIHLAT